VRPGPSGVSERAARRFDGLRAAALSAIADGALSDLLADPPPPPAGRCLAVIGRLVDQTAAAAVARTVAAIDEQLGRLGTDVWRYPAASLHLSVLAVSGRESEPTFDAARRQRAIDAFPPANLTASPPFGFRLGRVGLTGPQLFVEVVPDDRRWATLRGDVAELARRIGEAPLVFPDTEPVHLNVARLTGPVVDHTALVAAITGPSLDIGLAIDRLELVLTDFTVSDEATTVLSGGGRTPR